MIPIFPSRKYGKVFFSVLALFFSISILWGATASDAQATTFVVGDRVQTTADLNIRSSPSLSGTVLGVQLSGTVGTVIGGPITVFPYTWWQINFDTGADGWGVENYLEKVGVTPPPVALAAATGKTYYVATTGSDANPGTEASPFRTVNKGVKGLKPGDTLYVKSGTYAESLFNVIPSGTSWSAPVTVAAYPGHTVTLKPPAGSYRVLHFQGAATHYISIEGFILDSVNAAYDAVKITSPGSDTTDSAHHIRIRNCEVRNSQSNGLLVGGEFNEFSNLKVHNTGLGGTGHGFYIGGDDNLVENSTVFDGQRGGIQFWNQTGSSDRNIARNNKIYNTVSNGIALGHGQGQRAYNNVVWNTGLGIQVLSQTDGTLVYNNTVFDNNNYGILIGADSHNTRVMNNISYANAFAGIYDTGPGTVLANNLTTDPKFVNPATNDFHLQSTSPGINKGITLAEVPKDFDGVTRPQGPAYDIGAYEYVSSVSLPTVTLTSPDASASETAPNPGTFRISRTGSTASSLVVSYTRTGTAATTDYTPTLSGTLTIPAGQTNADIIITPVNDTLVESTETVILTLAPSATYTIGTPSAATVSIIDNDVAFNFSLPIPANQSVTQGQSVTNSISINLVSGTPEPVSLTAVSVPPLTGGTMSFNPTSCTPTCSTTMTIATTASTPVGTYTITVTGTAGSVVRTTSFTLTVNAGFLQLYEAEAATLTSPMVIGTSTVAFGGKFIHATTGSDSTAPVPEATLAITLPTTGTYYLWVRMMGPSQAQDALYAGINATWDRIFPSAPGIYEWVRVETANGSGVYGFSLALGSHTLRIGHGELFTQADAWFVTNNSVATPPSVVPFNFSLTNGGNRSITQGQSTTNPITATLVSGTSQAVSFSTSGLPTGATPSFSPTSCTPTCSSTMTIATTASTPVGTYTITVIGTAGSLVRTTSFTLTVNALPLLTMTVGPNLSWTSLYTSSCTASGGWSGSKPLSGSEPLPLVTTTQSFILTCTGPGGSVARTARVSVE